MGSNLPAKDVHKDKKRSNQLSIQLASLDYVKNGYKVIVVSSAMSGVTNDLIKKSRNISNNLIIK